MFSFLIRIVCDQMVIWDLTNSINCLRTINYFSLGYPGATRIICLRKPEFIFYMFNRHSQSAYYIEKPFFNHTSLRQKKPTKRRSAIITNIILKSVCNEIELEYNVYEHLTTIKNEYHFYHII